jgi:hypothetical protein
MNNVDRIDMTNFNKFANGFTLEKVKNNNLK